MAKNIINDMINAGNHRDVMRSTEIKVRDILIELIQNLDYYGVDSFKKQLTEYAMGQRSTNIGDGMCVCLGDIKTQVQGNKQLMDLIEQGYKKEVE
jgi:hypothetical protein